MAASVELQGRIREIAWQLAQASEGEAVAEGSCLLADIEERAAEIGDELMRAFLEQSWQQPAPAPAHACCPNCGQAGHHVSQRERPLVTRRGEATIHEAECYCPCCRKAFFSR